MREWELSRKEKAFSRPFQSLLYPHQERCLPRLKQRKNPAPKACFSHIFLKFLAEGKDWYRHKKEPYSSGSFERHQPL